VTPEYTSVPWTDGTVEDALQASAAGKTLPLANYSITAKNGKTYTGVLVGGNPFAHNPHPVTLQAVLIPLVVQIVGKRNGFFDPTAPDPCDGGISAVIRFIASPVVNPSELTFNGVDVGYYQYVDGFMRAEFWNEITQFHGGAGYSNPIQWTYFPEFVLPVFVDPATARVNGSGCAQYGLVSKPLLDQNIRNIAIPLLQAAGVIAPNQLAMFLLRNVASKNPPLGGSGCCTKGYHSAVGNPPQTYAVVDFNTSTNTVFGAVHDITTSVHELAEWMNDPLLSNTTPPWGGTGQVSGCNTGLEVGDPLTGTVLNFPGYGSTYHPQEIAFFSWFFNARHTPSLGAGGVFSSNGTFNGPAKKCPPGGSY